MNQSKNSSREKIKIDNIIGDPLFKLIPNIENKYDLADFLAHLNSDLDSRTIPNDRAGHAVCGYLKGLQDSLSVMDRLHAVISLKYNPKCANWQTMALLFLSAKHFADL